MGVLYVEEKKERARERQTGRQRDRERAGNKK